MSDRGQHTSSSATPADDVPDRTEDPASGAPAAPPVEPAARPVEPGAPLLEPDAPESPPVSGLDAPLELSATDDGDAPFSLTGPDAESETPPPARTARTVVLASLLVVSLAGASTLAWFGWQVNTQRKTTLSTPSTIGALSLDDSEQATSTADYLQSALSAEIALDKAVGAVYNSSDERSVLFFGGTTLLWSPESDLDSSFNLVDDNQGTVSGLQEVDAGDFGGVMKCGVSRSTDGDMTVCGWADHGSIALALFPSRTEAEAAPLMRELRSAIQTRG
ncbi:hypothetical protein Axi01nite_16430 [Actinoplanes xinjiangensis]|nr:hypothetical protein Axi01nite_16430 [Actinoplanes xinjiangensis]